ncbi:stage II sporulation protein E [Halalkalibacillus sediminis]|uniref:Stage II sporulation protein E n=1 Tax=Halalkalibacillus sediminis TaxID=2018042 RepID=A0A2I0QT44_9BACI|nr:stage II sporulation protein E [Halalkalibacillus sediminis]PKR77513.1 stage II sporulation protein E [Halalkalibacillus sediminis]
MDMLTKIGEITAESKFQRIYQSFNGLKQWLFQVLFEKGWLIMMISFFLGRAVILTSLSPFALAFLATTIVVKRGLAFRVFLFLMAGAVSINTLQGLALLSSGLLFLFFYKWFLSKAPHKTSLLITGTLLSSFIGRGAVLAVQDQLVIYDVAILTIEAVLSAFLVMIFLQSYPFLINDFRSRNLRIEEVICIVILSTAILSGLVGLTVSGVELGLVGSKYFVIVSAFIAGATVGSAIGVIVGLMLSLVSTFHLYQLSLLALAGLLGGLLKSTNKLGVSSGLFIASFLIGFYHVDTVSLLQIMTESALAAGLLLVTPNRWLKKIATFVPGTEESKEENDEYIQRVRNATAERVERFSEMFQVLSHSFDYFNQEGKQLETSEVDEYLSRVTEKTCQTCLKKHSCWVNNFDRTYPVLQQTMQAIEQNDSSGANLQASKLKKFCVKSEQVMDQMRYELSYYQANKRLKEQVKESRKFVSEQLNGVSEVMNNFAKEMLKERQEHDWHEAEVRKMLNGLSIEIEHLEIYSIDKGNVDIEMTLYFQHYHGEAEKIIAPMLSDLLSEIIQVEYENPKDQRGGSRTFIFSSIKRYQLTTGVAHAAKNGNFLSGDSYLMLELGKSRFALAISDGMGNGERAYLESSDTLRLLKQILQSGIHEQVAIQSINSILSLRTSDEIYATLDLTIIDLQQPYANFLKIGATVSYIVRPGGVYTVESSNLPIGILDEFDVDPVHQPVKDGDIIVMLSDGILETANTIENREVWLKRKLREMETDHPQEIADLILEEAIRSNNGEITDDMTVLVAKINKSKPKWASFSIGSR